jgi:PAS domain-containing protein
MPLPCALELVCRLQFGSARPGREVALKVWTDYDGAILEISPRAAAMLNVAARSLTKRPFYLFFNGDRHRALKALDLAVRGQAETFDALLRPRERKFIQVRITLEPAPPEAILWTITPV